MRDRVWRLGGSMLAAAGLGFAVVGLTASTARAKPANVAVTTTSTAPTSTATTSTDPEASLPGYGRPTVLLGDKNTPEQFVLGELYAAALQAQGYKVELTRNIGPPAVAEQALAQGSLDLYPEYLNVWDGEIVGVERNPATLPEAHREGQRWARAHKLDLLPAAPFSDTAGVVVSTPYASGNHLRRISDLIPIEHYLTFGAPLPFLQAADDGLPALEAAYGFKPGKVQQLDVGGGYAALTDGAVQAAYGSTTDPQLADPDYRLLADPAHVFGIGNVVPVVSEQTLLVEGPAFIATLEQVDSLLRTRVMRGLNAEVELQHHSAAQVARTFLQGNGILPPPPWATRGVQLPPTTTTGTTATSTTDTGGAETTG